MVREGISCCLPDQTSNSIRLESHPLWALPDTSQQSN